ncbi:sensor histidine kinase [Hufsiella ginkgonis]|uniref:histidine kinase n=1 Tax=Hufsiella ginkgonis TaxID=2695274 RepID=A0A7K1XU37_9SPHI|nr:ATP-binding protein [Hufsiella ginkgonis]MXV14279.1 hypothetical protein [Hufsiella ginkgonis]
MRSERPLEIHLIVILISVFFILLIAIIIVTALFYHSKKRLHAIEVANFGEILLQSQLEVKEQTLRTVGTDLHDNIGQLLSLTALMLGSIEAGDWKLARDKIDSAIDLTNESLAELRSLGKLIHGEQLLAMGLDEAVRKAAERIIKSGKYEVNYRCADLPSPGSNGKDLIIYRVIQEILANIIKHACATTIDIGIDYQDNHLQVKISDDGLGFDPPALTGTQKGMGLFNIQKRVAALNGQTGISAVPEGGTAINFVIPYP